MKIRLKNSFNNVFLFHSHTSLKSPFLKDLSRSIIFIIFFISQDSNVKF